MKCYLIYLFLLFSTVLFAQDYRAEWKRVSDLESAAEIKKAAAETEKIYLLAKKQKNEPQVLKTFFYRAKYMMVLEEDAQVKIVNALKAERNGSSLPTSAIIESLYAEMLWDIYAKNRYKIDQRTHVEGPAAANFLVWDGKNFRDESAAAYSRSLEHRELLYNTPLANYEPIIDFNPILAKTNRPLYDFLAERYIEAEGEDFKTILSNDELKLLFGDNEAFQNFHIPKGFKTSHAERLRLLKEVEAYYSAKKDTLTLQRTTLRRLDFAQSILYDTYKYTHYLPTVNGFASSWGDSPFAYRAKLATARIYSKLANKKLNKDYNIKAVALCDEIIKHPKKNDVTADAMNLKSTIINPELSATFESFVAPGKPALALITFKNTDSLHLKIYKVTHKSTDKYDYYSTGLAKLIIGVKPYVSKTYQLPNTTDYFSYTTEIMLPELPIGNYIITVSSDSKNNAERQSYKLLQVTQLALIQLSTRDTIAYQVTDRVTGKPVINVKTEIGTTTTFTDKDGKVGFTWIPKNSNYIVFSHLGDTIKRSFYGDFGSPDNYVRASTQLYLDRAIYRPGQKVYFKGIVVESQNKQDSVLANIPVTVLLKDKNDETIRKLEVITNSFGSFTGEFDLPKTGSTGDYEIVAERDDETDYSAIKIKSWAQKNF